MTDRVPIIPYDERHEVFCPYCWSPGTEYHPAERWGRCHSCGRSWRFDPYTKPLDHLRGRHGA